MQASQKTQCPSCGAISVFKITTNEYKCNYCQINFSNYNNENIVLSNTNNNLVNAPAKHQKIIIIIALIVAVFLMGLGCAVYFMMGK